MNGLIIPIELELCFLCCMFLLIVSTIVYIIYVIKSIQYRSILRKAAMIRINESPIKSIQDVEKRIENFQRTLQLAGNNIQRLNAEIQKFEQEIITKKSNLQLLEVERGKLEEQISHKQQYLAELDNDQQKLINIIAQRTKETGSDEENLEETNIGTLIPPENIIISELNSESTQLPEEAKADTLDCKQCGHPIDGDLIFCRHCGSNVG